ncbi:MAG: polysaccharide pyruvyl transferase family protein [Gammaproteobacteria bacterium]|nr:polysaccharide pyruvyl transferase family protein [Gammaproteobacteria bacterium]
MNLYYYTHPKGNFGDDLNPIIFNHLLPNFFDGNDSTLFLGIGTLINHRIPWSPKKIVFGSGVGYGELPTIDDKWHFYCVRGPLSAKLLGLSESTAITDPAILIREIYPKEAITDATFISFMPHHDSTELANWKDICKLAGITYIDPAFNVKEVIKTIQHSKLLITEAMHGAIVADAYRIPWVPVVCYQHILPFKWLDWCQSIGVSYKPLPIKSVYQIEDYKTKTERIKNLVKRNLLKAHIWSNEWDKPWKKRSRQQEIEAAAAMLSKISTTADPILSNASNQSCLLDQLHTKLKLVESERG